LKRVLNKAIKVDVRGITNYGTAAVSQVIILLQVMHIIFNIHFMFSLSTQKEQIDSCAFGSFIFISLFRLTYRIVYEYHPNTFNTTWIQPFDYFSWIVYALVQLLVQGFDSMFIESCTRRGL